MKRSQKLLRGLFPCVFVLVAACTVLVPTDPNAFSVPPEAATKLRAGQSISLRNAYPTETIVMIYQGHWSTDLQKSTSTAMSMMERALTQRGIDVKPTADKLVTLRVTNVNAWMHGIMIAPQQSAKLQLEAVFGDGRSTTIDGLNTVTYGGAQNAVDGAIMYAVTDLLLHPAFIVYVNQ